MFPALRLLTRGWISLLFPASCPGCHLALEEGPEVPLCPDCSARLPRNRPPWCRSCGRSLYSSGAGVDLCRQCRRSPPPFEQVVSPFLYEGTVRPLAVALKYHGRISLAPALADWMAESVRQRVGLDPADLCLPVPMHSTRRRERTFNQAERLGRAVADRLGIPFRTDLLIRSRATLPQAGLTERQRHQNVVGAFSLRRVASVRGQRILLVDDIFTTGSTARACAKLLRDAGAVRVVLLTLAHGA